VNGRERAGFIGRSAKQSHWVARRAVASFAGRRDQKSARVPVDVGVEAGRIVPTSRFNPTADNAHHSAAGPRSSGNHSQSSTTGTTWCRSWIERTFHIVA